MTNVNQSAIRSYRVGSWYAIFGEHASVLLPESEKPRAGGLWELVDGGAEFDELLDALIATGLRTLPGFVLVSTAEDPTKIVLRGAARAIVVLDDREVVEVDGGAAATWVERAFSNVKSLQLLLEETTDEVDYDIVGGLVRVSRVDQPPHTEPVAESITEEIADVAGLTAVPGIGILSAEEDSSNQPGEFVEAVEPDEPVETEETPLEVQPATAAESAPSPPSNPFAAGVESQDPPIWEPPAAAAAPAWGAAPAPVAPSWGDESADSAPGADEQRAAEDDHDHDGRTLAGSVKPDQFARQHPGIPGQQQVPSVTAQPVANLLFSNAETVQVDRAVLIGRAPEARRFTSTDQPRLVTVPSPNSEISSTHLEVRPGSGVDHGSAIVTDMGSTNGTVLVQPGLSPEDLQPGIAVQLLPGAVIDLGDGVTIQVTHP